ncbi:MAG: MBL fold metallo-hydrolase [Firmicutes bacterium ML8_F2]|jgi:anaerobic nitric oxide reductase flavorubredoxin|nr:MAG: MBL fold metallo-hydrolase [Firmicutes bacterium ML8_F2]
MPAVTIKPGIHWIGVNDHTTDLFEGLWPISREGVSYNSYIVKAEKTAIIDLAKSIKVDEYIDRLNEITDVSGIDYIILNHMEPDHTGILKLIRNLAPQAEILCSAKAVPMVENFYGITNRVRAVENGEELDLGGKKLKFFMTPFVHWPETMMTYETGSQILFSCDAFGSYGALGGGIFDDKNVDFDFYEKEALRYYANIVASFSAQTLRAIEKLKELPVSVIAPSHGLIWRNNPTRIINLYKQWAEYAKTGGKPAVTVLYGSMYGNTGAMMDAVTQGLTSTGISVDLFDVSRTHGSYILPSLWEKQGVVLGVPTYEGRLFPPAAHFLDLAGRKSIKNKKLAYFGSYGWSGGARRELDKILETLKWELVDSFDFAGGPTMEDFKKGEVFGKNFGNVILNKQ